MFPLRDNIPSRHVPFVNYLLIAACGIAFYMQLSRDQDAAALLVERYGMVPARVLHPDESLMTKERELRATPTNQLVVVERERPLKQAAVNNWLTLLTCIFLHGGWMHFLGNMWFLFIFGDNVEDRFGHVGYLAFYLGCGAAASAAHLVVNPGSVVPTIGASGAIAGVMGAYLLLYPKAKVLSLVPVFFILVVVLPAPVFLGIWFLLQLFSGVQSVGGVQVAGVAWWAHIGGFAAGFVVAYAMKAVGLAAPPVNQYRPHTDHVGAYRYHRRF